MAKQIVNIGTVPNDGTGDPLRSSFEKVNSNFDELYGQTGFGSYVDGIYTVGSPLVITANTDTDLPNRATTRIESQLPNYIPFYYYAQLLTVSSVTGVFVVGETVTGGTSLATGEIIEVSGLNIKIENYNGTFTLTETITGSTSGATATLSALGSGKIEGRDGDNLDIMVYLLAKSSAPDQWVDIWIDITGGTGTPTNLANLYRQTFSFPKGSGIERGVLWSLSSIYTLNTWAANGGVIKIRSNNALEIYSINFNFDTSHKAK